MEEAGLSEGYAQALSRTLALSNQYLMQQVERSGLRGLASSHGDILVQLFAHDHVCMSELSQRIARDPSTVTALVKKLVAMGLAQTGKSPHDRRSTVVSLTEQGRALKDDFVAISARLEAVWHDGIDEADLQTMMRVLEAVRGNMRRAIEEESDSKGDGNDAV